MKKIIMLMTVIIASIVTIYSVAFWQPDNDLQTQASYKENSVGSDAVKGDEVKNTNVKSGENKRSDGDVISAVSVNNSIYKINKDEIRDKISKEDWEKVNNIVKEMSIVDIERIKRAEENGEEGTKEVFNILNTRLVQNNYKVIEEIFNPYIDFSILEERV